MKLAKSKLLPIQQSSRDLSSRHTVHGKLQRFEINAFKARFSGCSSVFPVRLNAYLFDRNQQYSYLSKLMICIYCNQVSNYKRNVSTEGNPHCDGPSPCSHFLKLSFTWKNEVFFLITRSLLQTVVKRCGDKPLPAFQLTTFAASPSVRKERASIERRAHNYTPQNVVVNDRSAPVPISQNQLGHSFGNVSTHNFLKPSCSTAIAIATSSCSLPQRYKRLRNILTKRTEHNIKAAFETWTESNWTSEEQQKCSCNGLGVSVNEGSVIWSSTFQKATAKLSAKAQFSAL